ncbi:LysM peptidoglycan-binding domain-containing protein [Bacillus sp. PK3_68]|uniref:LysM peptidoglycan-binding domain-containing protein n=1 Tax=Bacillus sp. PK3_68 TaxID=2027408 RepID=UPI000E71FA22|nr:LysM peptidoglycan-binding domain-containing protein [Bacillus sp. PK3_68]RJS59143.1 phage portal protein [Bacillus sp. PK3_68]
MTKNVYEIWLSWQNGKEKFQLPILPPTIEINSPSKNENIDLADFGEITILQEPGAKTFKFSSFFPAKWSPLCEVRPTKLSMPWNYVKRLEAWRESKLPIRLIMTGTPINFAVSIDEFFYKEGDKDIGDIDYDLTLKEYIFVTSRKIDTKKKTNAHGGNKQRPDTKPVPKTYKVKKGDTLTGIAKVIYKNSAEWKTIWEANKQMLIKRDKRNVKQPGRFIYPGQVLTIPQKTTGTGMTAVQLKKVQTGVASVTPRK